MSRVPQFRRGAVPLFAMQEEALRRAFCLFDTDHSRGIDRGEFAAMMCKLNMSGQAEQLDRMFATADTNGDGSITFDEVYPRCVSNSSTRPMMAPPDLSCVRALTCGTSLRPSSRKSRRGRRERRRKRARGKSDRYKKSQCTILAGWLTHSEWLRRTGHRSSSSVKGLRGRELALVRRCV